jgi:hypothetical protein
MHSDGISDRNGVIEEPSVPIDDPGGVAVRLRDLRIDAKRPGESSGLSGQL